MHLGSISTAEKYIVRQGQQTYIYICHPLFSLFVYLHSMWFVSVCPNMKCNTRWGSNMWWQSLKFEGNQLKNMSSTQPDKKVTRWRNTQSWGSQCRMSSSFSRKLRGMLERLGEGALNHDKLDRFHRKGPKRLVNVMTNYSRMLFMRPIICLLCLKEHNVTMLLN